MAVTQQHELTASPAAKDTPSASGGARFRKRQSTGYRVTDRFSYLWLVVALEAVLGLAFGVIFEGTRNLVAPSVVHIPVNTMDI
jgi:hypothetical protein